MANGNDKHQQQQPAPKWKCMSLVTLALGSKDIMAKKIKIPIYSGRKILSCRWRLEHKHIAKT